jgi:hypothetical protein
MPAHLSPCSDILCAFLTTQADGERSVRAHGAAAADTAEIGSLLLDMGATKGRVPLRRARVAERPAPRLAARALEVGVRVERRGCT